MLLLPISTLPMASIAQSIITCTVLSISALLWISCVSLFLSYCRIRVHSYVLGLVGMFSCLEQNEASVRRWAIAYLGRFFDSFYLISVGLLEQLALLYMSLILAQYFFFILASADLAAAVAQLCTISTRLLTLLYCVMSFLCFLTNCSMLRIRSWATQFSFSTSFLLMQCLFSIQLVIFMFFSDWIRMLFSFYISYLSLAFYFYNCLDSFCYLMLFFCSSCTLVSHCCSRVPNPCICDLQQLTCLFSKSLSKFSSLILHQNSLMLASSTWYCAFWSINCALLPSSSCISSWI